MIETATAAALRRLPTTGHQVDLVGSAAFSPGLTHRVRRVSEHRLDLDAPEPLHPPFDLHQAA